MAKEWIVPDADLGCDGAYFDYQELVRCRECKWYKEGYDIDGKWFSRCNGSVRTYGHTTPDWFCADGERKVQE